MLVARGRSPEWSPDCRRIAYIALRSEVRFSPGPLMVVSAAGGDARQLFEPGATEPPADDCLWSPDGRTLFYKAHDAQGRASFWSVSAEGGAPRLLVRFEDPERQSARKDFAMDARRFYFAVEDRQSDVFVAEVLRK